MLQKATLQYPPKDRQLYQQLQHFKEKFNAVVDWANNLKVGSESSGLTKVGAAGVLDYLSTDQFSRTSATHITLRKGAIKHAMLSHLGTDDHVQYLLHDGSRALTGNWDAGSFYVQAERFISDVTTGASPLTVTSTTLCSNLNADKVDGADLIDEDNMASNSDVHFPTQQSVVAYITTFGGSYVLHSLADAANDFLVASGADTFVKKTLAETGAILEADISHDNLVDFVAEEHLDWRNETNSISTTGNIKGYFIDSDGANPRSRYYESGTQRGEVRYAGASDEFLYYTGNAAGTMTPRLRIKGEQDACEIGINNAPVAGTLLTLGMATKNLEFIDAGTVGATYAGWIQVEVGGATMYIPCTSGK